jgi:hypothetical protein
MGASTNCEFAEERIKALAESCTALERQMVELLALRNRVRRAQRDQEAMNQPLKRRDGRPYAPTLGDTQALG